MIISVDLIGRLLLIERSEALTWGFDPAASINASSDHASASAGYADPCYGTFPTETGFPAESGWQASDTSIVGETSSTDALLDRGASTHGALKSHTRDEPMPFLRIIKELFKSSRAVAAVVNSFVYGYVA
jgi:hypothetical protein